MSSPADLSALEARRLIGLGRLGVRELVEAAIARVRRVDPVLNAMPIRCFERARAEAVTADAAIKVGASLGPLHGLPVAIKDLTDVAGLPTTRGSPLFRNAVAESDARLVAELRRAGAIVIGKTNVPEHGAGGNTFNPVFGATGNPFDPALTCSGSSGGAAVALATGMASLATGSDLGGSLRTPAAFCGVVGLRPTAGLVPAEGRPFGWTPLAVEGPMGRSVEDCALLLSAMTAADERDPLTAHAGDGGTFRTLPMVDLGSLRVGISQDLGFAKVDPAIRRLFADRMAALMPLFGRLEPIDPGLAEAEEIFEVLRGAQFVGRHADMVERHPDQVGPLVTANVRYGLTLTVRQVMRAEEAHTQLFRRFQALFRRHDLIVAPTSPVPPFPKAVPYLGEIEGRPVRSYLDQIALTYGLTLTGSPVLAVPLGRDHTGMPFGIQLVARRGADRELLGIGLALERALAGDALLGRPVPDLDRLVPAG